MNRVNQTGQTSVSISKAVKGATKPKEAPPKSKYVQCIQDHLEKNHSDADLTEFFTLLRPRLCHDSENYLSISSLKAHILFHTHILSDNNYTLPKYYLWGYISEYDTKTLPTLSSAPQCASHRLAMSYNRYLNQRISDFAQLKIDPLREKRDNTSVVDNNTPVVINLAPSSTNLLDQAQCIIVQVRLILDCTFTTELLDNPLYNCLYNLLATDLATLFNFLNLTIVHALQNFFSLARPDAERTLFLYKEYTQLQIIDEVYNFTALAANMVSTKELQVPSALKQNYQSIQQLTKALESYLFSRNEAGSIQKQINSNSHDINNDMNNNEHSNIQRDTNSNNNNNNNTHHIHPTQPHPNKQSSQFYQSNNSSFNNNRESSIYSDGGTETPTQYEYDSCNASKYSLASLANGPDVAVVTVGDNNHEQQQQPTPRREPNSKSNQTSSPPTSMTDSMTSASCSESGEGLNTPITPSTEHDENGAAIWSDIFGTSFDKTPSLELDTRISFAPSHASSNISNLDKPLPPPPIPEYKPLHHGLRKTKSFARLFRKT